MSAWTYLAIGIVLEVIGTSCLKFSQGFSHLLPGIAGLVCFLFALICISLSVKTLELGVVYAIWSGCGIAIITLIGIFAFSESVSPQKLLFIGLILIGVVGLQITTESSEDKRAVELS